MNVYRPESPSTAINLGTMRAGTGIILAGPSDVGNDWWIQVDNSALRIISHVCDYSSHTIEGMYWNCAGMSANPFNGR